MKLNVGDAGIKLLEITEFIALLIEAQATFINLLDTRLLQKALEPQYSTQIVTKVPTT